MNLANRSEDNGGSQVMPKEEGRQYSTPWGLPELLVRGTGCAREAESMEFGERRVCQKSAQSGLNGETREM